MHNNVNILNTTELCTLKKWLGWCYMYLIIIKKIRKKNQCVQVVNLRSYDFPVFGEKRTIMKLLNVSSLSGFCQNNIWNMCEKNDGLLARQLAYRMMTWDNLK